MLKILKAPSWMYDCVLNMPLEGFVQDCPRKKLIAPFVECLTTTVWQNYHK